MIRLLNAFNRYLWWIWDCYIFHHIIYFWCWCSWCGCCCCFLLAARCLLMVFYFMCIDMLLKNNIMPLWQTTMPCSDGCWMPAIIMWNVLYSLPSYGLFISPLSLYLHSTIFWPFVVLSFCPSALQPLSNGPNSIHLEPNSKKEVYIIALNVRCRYLMILQHKAKLWQNGNWSN